MIVIVLIAPVAFAVIYILCSKCRHLFFKAVRMDADAIILTMQLTGIRIKDKIQAIIQLQVQPEMGKSFVSDTKEMLSAVEYAKVQPGARVKVKYNPRNHKEVFLIRA